MSDMTRTEALDIIRNMKPPKKPREREALSMAYNSLQIDEQYDLMYEQAEPREVVNVLEEIIQYTYGMITAEKFGLQQFLISKLDKYNSKLYDEKGET